MAVVLAVALAVGVVDDGGTPYARGAGPQPGRDHRVPGVRRPVGGRLRLGGVAEGIRSADRRADRPRARATTQIRDELAAAYGEQVLLTPGSSGVAGLVWVLPVVALVLALAGAGVRVLALAGHGRRSTPATPTAHWWTGRSTPSTPGRERRRRDCGGRHPAPRSRRAGGAGGAARLPAALARGPRARARRRRRRRPRLRSPEGRLHRPRRPHASGPSRPTTPGSPPPVRPGPGPERWRRLRSSWRSRCWRACSWPGFAGRREAGDALTGDIRESTRTQLDDAPAGPATGALRRAPSRSTTRCWPTSPTTSRPWPTRDWAQIGAGDSDGVVTLIDAAEADPDYPDTHYFLAGAFAIAARYDSALQELDRFDALDPPPDLAAQADDLRSQIEALQAAATTSTTAPR